MNKGLKYEDFFFAVFFIHLPSAPRNSEQLKLQKDPYAFPPWLNKTRISYLTREKIFYQHAKHQHSPERFQTNLKDHDQPEIEVKVNSQLFFSFFFSFFIPLHLLSSSFLHTSLCFQGSNSSSQLISLFRERLQTLQTLLHIIHIPKTTNS